MNWNSNKDGPAYWKLHPSTLLIPGIREYIIWKLQCFSTQTEFLYPEYYIEAWEILKIDSKCLLKQEQTWRRNNERQWIRKICAKLETAMNSPSAQTPEGKTEVTRLRNKLGELEKIETKHI